MGFFRLGSSNSQIAITGGEAGAARTRGHWRPGPLTVMTLVLWGLAYAYFSYTATMTDSPFGWQQYPVRAGLCAFAIGLCAIMHSVLSQTLDRPATVRFGLAAALAMISAMAYALCGQVAFRLVFPNLAEPLQLLPTLRGLLWNASGLFWVFLAWAVIFFAFRSDASARDRELELSEARLLLAGAQNQLLRYQINPHFLFNTLNTLSSLIVHRDNDTAEAMLQSLAGFLRSSLYADLDDAIPLARELEIERQYLAIEQVRFGDRLAIEEHVPAELAQAQVPTLILQPLVENAVKHGFARMPARATIRIRAERQGDRIAISVEDDGLGPTSASAADAGLGLQNVRRRLELLYGPAASLSACALEPHGYRVVVTLPLEPSEA